MKFDKTILDRWRRLGAVPPAQLIFGRLHLHHAVQLVSAVGRCLLPARPDDSHTNLEWLEAHQALAGETVHGESSARWALRLKDLTLLQLHADNRLWRELPLKGLTAAEALDSLRAAVQRLGLPGEKLDLNLPYNIPDNPVAGGRAFHTDDAVNLQELSRYFSNADRVLQALGGQTANASPVRCWPHHFDIATLITEKPGSDAESARTIGVGLSPGDDSYELPYFYITPWPYPETTDLVLPELPGGGRWHQEGWFGAVLTADQLLRDDSAAKQAERVIAFLSAGVQEARRLVAQT